VCVPVFVATPGW